MHKVFYFPSRGLFIMLQSPKLISYIKKHVFISTKYQCYATAIVAALFWPHDIWYLVRIHLIVSSLHSLTITDVVSQCLDTIFDSICYLKTHQRGLEHSPLHGIEATIIINSFTHIIYPQTPHIQPSSGDYIFLLFVDLFILLLLCVSILPVHMYVCHCMHVCPDTMPGAWGSQKWVWCPLGTERAMNWLWVLEIKLCPLQDKYVLLTTQPTLSFLQMVFLILQRKNQLWSLISFLTFIWDSRCWLSCRCSYCLYLRYPVHFSPISFSSPSFYAHSSGRSLSALCVTCFPGCPLTVLFPLLGCRYRV